MNTKIYVGNLPYSADENTLSDIFKQFGDISDVTIIFDRISNRSKGFGFITFETPEGAQSAVDQMNEQEMEGRKLKVSMAKPPKSRDGGGRGDRGDRGDRGGRY